MRLTATTYPQMATSCISGDIAVQFSDGDERSLFDTLADPRAPSGHAALQRLEGREFWAAVRAILTPREYQAVALCYRAGLATAEIAARMQVSAQRIRQLITSAHGKLYRALREERIRRAHDRLLWD